MQGDVAVAAQPLNLSFALFGTEINVIGERATVTDVKGDTVIGSLAGGRYLLRPGRYTIMSSGSPNAFFMGAGGKNTATEAPIAAYCRSVVSLVFAK